MAIILKQPVNRMPGFSLASGVTTIAGKVAILNTSDTTGATIQLATTTSSNAIGLVLETSATGGTGLGLNSRSDTAGSNLVSVATNGGWYLIYNDGRGCPYDDSRTYTLGQPLWPNSTGQVSNVAVASGITNQVGICTKVPSSATDSLGIKLLV